MGDSANRRARGVAASIAAVLVLAGCAPAAIEDDDPGVELLTPSVVWRNSVSEEAFRTRISELTRAIETLRSETSSNWTGRQDDVTGYLTELAGGRYPGGDSPTDAAGALLAAHGPALLGIGAYELRFPTSQPFSGGVSLRGEQHVLDVPVLGGGVVVTLEEAGDALEVTTIRGRVFPGMGTTAIEPRITRDEAVEVATEASQGSLDGEPRLVVLPQADRGVLAWEVGMVGAKGSETGTAVYLVDAHEGVVLAVQPGALGMGRAGPGGGPSLGAQIPDAALEGTSVTVSGPSPTGETLEGTGVRTSDGSILLVDTTTPSYDPATGEGAVSTHDAAGLPDRRLPGPVASSTDTTFDDSDFISAHVYGRYVLDYYREVHGRDSWDGAGGSLVSSADFGPPDFCNAYFGGTQMVYGASCIINGDVYAGAMTDVDTAGHEITHGVTETTSALEYTGQSGALNESFSDYFGNVIGDRFKGFDTVANGEDGCFEFTGQTGYFCNENPDGTLSIRYMLNGATMADYAYLLDPPFLTGIFIPTDQGGVHLNSDVWNHALWSIRTRLAEMDGTTGIESPRAQTFDAAVYGALTRHLTPTSQFIDARAAVEQAAAEVGADTETTEVIRQTFDASLICTGCTSPSPTPALPVATTTRGETLPTVSGENVAWIEFADWGLLGAPNYVRPGGQPTRVSGDPFVYSVGFAGDALVGLESAGEVVRYDLMTGERQVLDTLLGDDALIPVAGSAEGAAWLDLTDRTLNFVDPTGSVRTAPVPAELTDERFLVTTRFGLNPVTLPVAAVGTGGGTVALGTASGDIVVWKPGADPSVVAEVQGRVLGIGVHGDNVLASVAPKAGSNRAILVNAADGITTTLSTNTLAFGAAVSGDYAVWSEMTGVLPGAIALANGYPDTNLALYSFATGRTYTILDQRGMQGFPSISGNTLAWQDAVNGGDDIYMGTLPAGL